MFDNGHYLHNRYQTYFRKIGILATDVVREIDYEYVSKITGKTTKILVKCESGMSYPFSKKAHIWVKGKDKEPNPWTRIKDLQIGDEFYLAEVPFEYEKWHMSGSIDAILKSMINYMSMILKVSIKEDLDIYFLIRINMGKEISHKIDFVIYVMKNYTV